jgi:hypothetical protein
MREKIVVTIGGTKTLLGKTGVHTLLHCESKKWYSIIQGANLKTMKVWYGEGQMSPLCGGGERSCCATNGHTAMRQQHSALRHSLSTTPLNREI